MSMAQSSTQSSEKVSRIETRFTKMMGCSLPLIGAPMFLVSSPDLMVEVTAAGGVGTAPALNFRPLDVYRETLESVRKRAQGPIGINIIVNKSNQRQGDDLRLALDVGVDLLITSLGSPREVIQEAHKNGAKVICDVTNLEHARRVQDLGADGVIAVGSGAGGHAGPISPLVLIPWLKKELEIPVIAAGGIADGRQWAAALVLGADAVSVGTRFIASHEARVEDAYKQAVVSSGPEDIVMTTRLSGTPASVIRTPYIDRVGLELPWILKLLKSQPKLKRWVVPLIHQMGFKSLEVAAEKPTWKQVWSAGQSVGLVEDILPAREIVRRMVVEFQSAMEGAPRPE